MSTYQSLPGTMQTVFHIGGPAGPTVVRSSSDLQIRDAANSAMANLQVARASAADHATSYTDLKERALLIEFSFAGASAPAPGANTGKYGMCHTSGSTYTAGSIYLDNGTSLALVTTYKGSVLASTTVVTGTVSLITNGVYVAQTGTAPYTWTLKGDGAASGTGSVKLIKVTVPVTGGVSTTVIPTSSKVMAVYTNVTTPFSAGGTIATTVSATTIQPSADVEATVAGVYKSEELTDIGTGAIVTVTVGGSPALGAAEVVVSYVEAFLA